MYDLLLVLHEIMDIDFRKKSILSFDKVGKFGSSGPP